MGEYVGATKGAVLLVAQSQGTCNAAGACAAMVILAAVSLVAEGLPTFAARRVLRWKPLSGSES